MLYISVCEKIHVYPTNTKPSSKYKHGLICAIARTIFTVPITLSVLIYKKHRLGCWYTG